MFSLTFLVINFLFAVFVFFWTAAFITGAPFVPSTGKTARRMIELARLKRGVKVYDLGSGDGKLLFAAAKRGATAIGFEINPILVLYTRIKTLFLPRLNMEGSHTSMVRVFWRNFWRADFRDADIVFVYLLPWRMDQLASKLKQELKPGALVVSNSFIFPNWKILRQDRENHVYVFKIPERV